MAKLQEGDKAPAFLGKDQEGRTVSLDDFKGSKLILYFYPKDDTPGCTKEACNLRDNEQLLMSRGFKIVGVSVDDEQSHRKFAEKYNLPFPLIADADKSIVNAYGVWGEKNLYGRKFMSTLRTTFVINEEGVIEKIFRKVDTQNHAEQILKALNV